MTKRQTALALARVAGYHNDNARFVRLLVESRVNRADMNTAFAGGIQARKNGVKCSCSECNPYPLKDGQTFTTQRGTVERVAGEIKAPHAEPICYTLQGNWYRRADGEQMTGCNGEIMTAAEFYRRRVRGDYD